MKNSKYRLYFDELTSPSVVFETESDTVFCLFAVRLLVVTPIFAEFEMMMMMMMLLR